MAIVAPMGSVNKATAERMHALPFSHADNPSQPPRGIGAASHKAEHLLASRELTAFELEVEAERNG